MAFSDSEFESAVAEWESESEFAEARAPIRRPSSQPSFKPRPAPNAPNYVTQAQLEAALARSDGKIKTLTDGVGTITSRLSAISAATKKEIEDRKKTTESQSKDLNQKLQLLALLPLLVRPPSATVNQGATPLTDANNQPINQVSVPDTNSLSMLLPLLLVSGMGGTGGMGLGDGGGSDGSGLMLMALVLAFSSQQKS